MPAVMKLINNLNNINTCFSNGYELRGSMGNRQSQHNNNNKDSVVMNGASSNHLTRSAARNRLKEPLTVECNGFANSVSVRSDGVLVEKDTPGPGRLCRNKSKSCPGNGSQLGPLSPTDAVRPRRNIWKLPSCLLGTTAEDTRARGNTNPASKTDTKSNHTSVPCKYNHLSHVKSECKVLSKLQEDSNTNHIEKCYHVRQDRKLLEDNREYYKVEVLSAKLRSTRQFVKEYEARKLKEEREEEEEEMKNKTETNSGLETNDEEQNGDDNEVQRKTRQSHAEDSIYLSRKNLKLRHSRDSPEHESSTPVKKFRPNKITMIERLNMEADKFMFGDPRRELEEQESSPDTAAPKRKRKSHVELFLIDNLDYYKFELPASRLRNGNDIKTYREELKEPEECKGTIKIDFDNVKYSFEMGIQQELWYQVFLRSRSRTRQSLWQNKVPHQSKILLPFERKTRPGVHRSKQESLPPPPPPPEPETIQSHRRRKRRLSSIIEDDSRPRKSPRCHASTQAILSSHHIPGVRRSLLDEDSCTSSTPLHEPENFPECCEFARINPYSCDVRRLVDKLAKQLKLDISQVNLCEILRQYSRSYYSSLNTNCDVTGGTGSGSQPGDNSSDCGASSHLSSEGTGKRRERKKRRINMTGWPCRPKRKVAGKVVNYNENLAASLSSTLTVPSPPSLSPVVDRTTPSSRGVSTACTMKKKRGRKRRKGKAANRYKY
uniref:Uncharacterized protein n=1 Tax=Cacopsylla melanoneura TaxID=428564 RepID=A0A8D9DWV9_9HEMI